MQVHSGNLQAVLDMVVSHQGLSLKADLAQRLMTALVLPDPAHYRPLLRRMAVLRTKGSEQIVLRAHNLLVGIIVINVTDHTWHQICILPHPSCPNTRPHSGAKPFGRLEGPGGPCLVRPRYVQSRS